MRSAATIHTTASPDALTRAVSRAIGNNWPGRDFAGLADEAIEAICSHLRRVPDERLDPRLAEAIDSFLAYEYREGDVDQVRECAPEEAHGQQSIAFDEPAGLKAGRFPAVIDAEQTCSFDVKHGPDGKVSFENVRPYRTFLNMALVCALALAAGCAPAADHKQAGPERAHLVSSSESATPVAPPPPAVQREPTPTTLAVVCTAFSGVMALVSVAFAVKSRRA